MRVLVVEDEPDVGAVLGEFLKELGHEPVLTATAEGALGRLETAPPDAIILDIDLPGLSGLEFLQLERVRQANVPIVAVSGVASESQAMRCLELGAFDFVGKPVPFDLLGELLAYVEPRVIHRKQTVGPGILAWHRAHGSRADFRLRIAEHYGAEWEGRARALSPFAVTAVTEAEVCVGAGVKLLLELPDGRRPLRLMAGVLADEGAEKVFSFVNVTAADFRRLAATAGLVRRP